MRRNLPTVTALHAFEVVYRRQSISAAAQTLSLTQGAVSKTILALEDYFGQALFERHATGLRRTSAADRLWTRLPQCLDELEEVMAEIKSLASGGGVLNVAVCPTFAAKWLVRRLPLLYQSHPELSLNLRLQLDNVDFLARGIDVGITFGKPGWSGCDHYLIAREDLVPICSPDYLKAAGPIRDMLDLRSHTLLHLRTRMDHWDQWFALHGSAEGAPPKGTYFDLFSIVVEAAKAGMGVGLLPAIFVEEEIQNGNLVALFEAVAVSEDAYYLIYPSRKAGLPALSAFRQWLTTAPDSAGTPRSARAPGIPVGRVSHSE